MMNDGKVAGECALYKRLGAMDGFIKNISVGIPMRNYNQINIFVNE